MKPFSPGLLEVNYKMKDVEPILRQQFHERNVEVLDKLEDLSPKETSNKDL